MYTVNLSLSFPQRDPWLLTRVHWEKGNNWAFGGILDTYSRDPKYHCGPPARVGAYGGQLSNGVLDQVPLSVGPVCP